MADEIAEMCRRMRLSEAEKSNLRLRTGKIQQSKTEAKFSLLFRLLTSRSFNGEAFKGTVKNLWASEGGITIREIEDNLFLAVFNRGDDMERVIVQSPWTFDKKLIQFIRFEADMQPTAVKFIYSAFWIRIYNLPILSMVKEVGEDIGNNIGRLVEVDVPENGIGWGRFLRIRVEIDVTKPLLRGKILESEDGKPFWVEFRYEHLPIFCYRCGRIGHSGNECVEGRRSGGDQMVATDRFGSWLQAAPVRGGMSSRRHRETVQSDDDLEGSPSQGRDGEFEAARQAGNPIGVTSEIVEGVVTEESLLPRIRDPLSQQDSGDVMEVMGNSEMGGDLETNKDNNQLFEKSAQDGEDRQDRVCTQTPDLVLTEEEKVEICLEQVGIQPNVQGNQEGMDMDGYGQQIPTVLHVASCGDDKTDAILIMDQNITNISHSHAIPSNVKGKKVMGSGTEHDVGPKLGGKWKKRARINNHQGPPLQAPCTELVQRKRSLEDHLHGHLEGDNILKKKSKTGSGVVPNNDPLMVEAVGQPHQSQ
jgi:hypothetical protein